MKLKTVLAAFAAMITMGVSAQSWTAPTIQGEAPTSGGTYYVKNIGADQFLSGGKAWYSWSTSAIVADVSAAVKFTLTDTGSGWTLKRPDGRVVFISGSYNGKGEMHVDGVESQRANRFFEFIQQSNGHYRIRAVASDATYGSGMDGYDSKFWGQSSSDPNSPIGVYATVNPDNGYNCDWDFITDNSFTIFEARTALYNWYLEATAKGVNTDAYKTIYDNSSATVDELNAASNSLKSDILAALLPTASNENPVDITKYVLTNADISEGEQLQMPPGWETNYVSGQQAQNIGCQKNSDYTNETVTLHYFIEAWKPGATLGDGYLRQTVSGLPEGKFELSADAIATWQNDDTRVITGAQLYITADGVTYKTDMSTKNGKPQHFTTEFMNTGEGDVIFGLRTVSANCNWLCADNFKVTFYGIDLSPYATMLSQAVAEAQALNGNVPASVYNTLADVVTANNKAWETSKEYTTAIAAIQAATENVQALVAPYARYNSIKAAALAVAENTNTVDADAAANAASDAAAIEAAIVQLRAAFLAELPNVTIPSAGLDVTSVMVENASVRQNVDGWTVADVVRMDQYGTGPTTNYEETEFYHSNFRLYQTLALTPGTWEFGVTGFHRIGNHNTHFYAGEDQILIPGVESSVVNNMAEAKTYFDNGNGKVALKFLVEAAADIEIGINNQDTETDRWTIFRDFTLKYFGAPDYSVYETEWANLVAEANTAKGNHASVTGTELTALDAAIADSPAGSNQKAVYNAKISALQDALTAFNAAAPSYDAYVAYKNETIALWGSDLNVAAPTTAAGAVDAVHALNIAQYNKVAKDYTFSATGLIGDFGTWTGTATVAGQPGTPNYLDWEHWSGQTHAYYEQDADGYGNENGWTIKYEKTCILPAGSYVIKVAARSSVGTTSSVTCTATPTTISLPNVGGVPNRGINTNGVASWSDEDEFANGDIRQAANAPTVGGKGAGWQWRFLPFELTTESEVTMTFYAEATTKNQWMSISDGELLSTTKLAEDVVYDENNDNAIENKIIADVTMSRTIKAGYNTVVLPFTLTANQVTTAFGAGTEVYAFSEDSSDANDVTINFNKGDGSITANVPVLVKATEASSAQTFNGVQVVAPTEGAVVMGTNTKFIGVFGPLTITAGDYFVGNGAIYKSEGNTNMKAFRAYIYAQEASAPVKMYIGGIETAISEINADAAAEEQGAIFNLAGQRVNKAQKGIYVINGKKVLVK